MIVKDIEIIVQRVQLGKSSCVKLVHELERNITGAVLELF